MSNFPFDKLQRIFDEAVELPAADREAFLRDQCGDDPELFGRVQRLLQHDHHQGDFLEQNAPALIEENLLLVSDPDSSSQSSNDSLVSIQEFLSTLVESGLLRQEEVETIRQRYETDDTVTLARKLVADQKLTVCQAKLLLSGASHPLRLGNYLILDEIGVGGMGHVYLARHQWMKREVALKVLPPELARDPHSVERFQREVEAAAQLSHDHIVAAHDADQADGILFFVMEYVEGCNLLELVRQRGTLSVDQAVETLRQVASGLQYAHGKGIIHRDIKPGNVLLSSEGTIKILDMGLARYRTSSAGEDLTVTGVAMGTPDFMSPEQGSNAKDADERSDIYSLGCTFYFLLTGKSIYGGKSLVEKVIAHRNAPIPSLADHCETVPPQVESLFRKMVAKEPAKRFQTTDELLQAIAALPLESQSSKLPPGNALPLQSLAAGSAQKSTEWLPAPGGPHADGETHPSQHYDDTKRRAAPKAQPGSAGGRSTGKRLVLFVLGMAAVLIAAVTIEIQTRYGTLQIEVLDPKLSVTVDDDTIGFEQKGFKKKKRAGKYDLEVLLAGTPIPIDGKQVSIDGVSHELQVQVGNKTISAPQFDIARLGTTVIKVSLMPTKLPERTNESTIAATPVDSSTGSQDLATLLQSGQWEWSDPEPLPAPVNSKFFEAVSFVSSDSRSLYLNRYDALGSSDIFVSTRDSVHADWGTPVRLPEPINSDGDEVFATLSADGLNMVFERGTNLEDLKSRFLVARRDSISSPWNIEGQISVHPLYRGAAGCISSDGMQLYFQGQERPNSSWLIYRAHRDRNLLSWKPAVPVAEINRTKLRNGGLASCYWPSMSIDQRGLLWMSDQDGTARKLWFAGRETADGPWTWKTKLDPKINLGNTTRNGVYDSSTRTLYFTSERPGGLGNADIWRSRLVRKVATPTPLKLTTYQWPTDRPAPAIAPFTAEEAQQYQEEWAKHLAVSVETINSIGMKFRVVPPGEFLMGTSNVEIENLLEEAKKENLFDWYVEQIPDEGPQHKVTITKPFGLAIDEVTRGQFRQFVEATGYKTDAERDGKGGKTFKNGEWIQAPEILWNTPLGVGTDKTDEYPVVNVSWNDAKAFCEWLSEKEGVTYRLPAEAEWEFACRAGNPGRFSLGDDDSKLSEYAWREKRSGTNSMPVGKRRANAFGLFDMHGNVAEWCEDGFGPYKAEPAVDPVGSLNTPGRVIRGGSFYLRSLFVRSANRIHAPPAHRLNDIGFRVVRSFEKYDPKHEPERSTYNWPDDQPAPAIAPFSIEEAKQHQQDWASHLGVPVEYVNRFGMKFRLIPPGEFMMGSTDQEIAELVRQMNPTDRASWYRNEGPQHPVVLTQPFYLATTEVTIEQYRALLTVEADQKTDAPGEAARGMIVWKDAIRFCNAISQREFQTDAYEVTNVGATRIASASAYRLPTESEWEFSCRAGTVTPWSFGEHDADLGDHSWYRDNAKNNPSRIVGKLPGNPFGLFDMHGNLWEWCEDHYQLYSSYQAVDPAVVGNGGFAIRGGSWADTTNNCRSAFRPHAGSSGKRIQVNGFRVALDVDAVGKQLAKSASVGSGRPN